MHALRSIACAAASVLAGATIASAAPVTFAASGGNAGAIQAQVDAYRADLGTQNPNVAGSAGSGRREINWDGVPDNRAAPNALPADFFNVTSPRGTVFSTPGSAVAVSASAASGTAVRFGNVNPTYTDLFQTFSPQRLFSAIGSNVLDVTFFVPGSSTPALTRGFGSVFTDVDLANTSSIEYFDANDVSLGLFYVPAAQGNGTLSFLGVDFGSNVVGRARITSGTAALGPNETAGIDLVAMDDFIYGEPVARTAAVPEPASLMLLAAGVAGTALAGARRRRTFGG